MIAYPLIKTVMVVFVLTAWIVFPISDRLMGQVRNQCPSGHSAARLTGWPLNGATPKGLAKFNETTRLLEVSVESVELPDGKILSVLIGEDRIGQLEPLKDGKAVGTVTRAIADAARVRVFDGDRPIVSANLACVSAPAVVATVSPALPRATPTPSPTPTPGMSPTATPTASPTVSPGPTAEPTQDPMPKPSPMPTPSPGS